MINHPKLMVYMHPDINVEPALAVSSSLRPWIAVFVLLEKIDVFQHGGE